MADFKKIEYYDLRQEAARGVLPNLIGRQEEAQRLARVVGRRIRNNAVVVGSAGIGKTTLLRGFAKKFAADPAHKGLELIQFEAEHLQDLTDEQLSRYLEALCTLPKSVLFIDDAGRALYNNSELVQRVLRLYIPLLRGSQVAVILAMQPHEYSWLEREHPSVLQVFETITLKNQVTAEQVAITAAALPRLNRGRSVSPELVAEIVRYAERFPSLGTLPRSAITLLDECLAQAAAAGAASVTEQLLSAVVAAKTGVPADQVGGGELSAIAAFESKLNERVVGQPAALKAIAGTLQRASLGVRNQNRPRGSFLLLGPSGVGKTETAKAVAELIFGKPESFIRFDMSEFGQEHTVARLIGAPAGYVGYDQGGALTGALRKAPHSLLLLDEIEKAHSSIFDIFLQVLDDGRLTSGQNETVDARHSVIMMTSNAAVAEMAAGISAGKEVSSPEFIRTEIMPVLARSFRLEFLNRFDHIVVFNPLTLEALMGVARLEIQKAQTRLSKHRVQFNVDDEVLRQRVGELADPRFGARPVKRFIEETCESLLLKSLISTS